MGSIPTGGLGEGNLKRSLDIHDLSAEAEGLSLERARKLALGLGRTTAGRGKKNQKATKLRRRGEGIVYRKTERKHT